MKINACPKCGSQQIYMGTMGSGVTFGITSWNYVCRACGYCGMPLIFDSKKEYETYYQDLHETTDHQKKASPNKSVQKPSREKLHKMTKKEQEILNFLNELQNETQTNIQPSEQTFHSNKTWWPEIIGAMLVSAFAVVYIYTPLFPSIQDKFMLILYSVLLFILLTLVILFILVILEYFMISIKHTLKK